MEVTVNGASRTLPPATTLADLVSSITEMSRGIAVAVNGAVVPRLGWPDTTLRPGDQVEVLTAAQGG